MILQSHQLTRKMGLHLKSDMAQAVSLDFFPRMLLM